jgi:hypothetical protein
MTASVSLYELAESVGFERRKVFRGAQDDRATVSATTSVRAATGFVLLAVKRNATVSATTGADHEAGFINKLQRG